MSRFPTIRVPDDRQGPTGSGQGGWTAYQLRRAIGQPITVAIKAPIPLEAALAVTERDGGWALGPEQGLPVMLAEPWRPDVPPTNPVSVADAAIAGRKFPLSDDHPVPHCFSCGLGANSMQVHSGQLPDGRWATDWTMPWWAGRAGRADRGVESDAGRRGDRVDYGPLWAAIDCAQAWYVSLSDGGHRNAVTVQLAVEVHAQPRVGETYAIVAWNGDYDDAWDGRKRGACGAVFNQFGRRIATSRSFWVALD